MGRRLLVNDTRDLLNLIVKYCYTNDKTTTLASGKVSSFYVDISNIMTKSLGVHLVGKLMFDGLWRLVNKYDHVYLVGVPIGGISIVTAILAEVHYHKIKNVSGLIVRPAKESSSNNYIIEGADIAYPNNKCIVIEDVATTGNSALNIVKILQNCKFDVAGIYSLVDRNQGAENNIIAKNLWYRWLFDIREIQYCQSLISQKSY